MRRLNILFVGLFAILPALSGCSTFEGVAGDPGETYTTTYNTPGMRIVPYNDPSMDVSEPADEVEVCEGLVKGGQMPRCDR